MKPDPDRLRRAERHFVSRKTDGASRRPARERKARHILGILRDHVAGRSVRDVLSIGASFCVIEEVLQRELLPQARFLCTDLDEEALLCFDQPGLDKRVVSATDLGLEEDSFDLILAHQVLEHINDYPSILEEFSRLCRPRGLLYINVPNPLSPMIGKLPDGTWPKPFLGALIRHNVKKLAPDFRWNTERHHSGFTTRALRARLPGFRIIDERKTRLRQEFPGRRAQALIDLFPSALLFLFVETNVWVLENRDPAAG